MTRHLVRWMTGVALCLTVSLAYAAPRGEGGSRGSTEGREGESAGNRGSQEGREEGNRGANQAPGGDWGQRTHSGKQTPQQNGKNEQGGSTAGQSQKQTSAQSATAAQSKQSSTSQPPAGSTTASTKTPSQNTSQYSAAQGAAAGAAAANAAHPSYVVVPGATGTVAGAGSVPGYAPAAGTQYTAPTTMPATAPGYAPPAGAQYPVAGTAPQAGMAPPTGNAAPPAGAYAPGGNVSANYPTSAGAAGGPPTNNAGAATDYNNVRNAFRQSPIYSQQWCLDHPGAWFATGWVPGAAWNATPWDVVAGLCSLGNVTPISYDYGVNVTANNGNVYVNGQNVGTTSAFSLQAAEAAWAGGAAEVSTADEWLPLGVFAMVRDERQPPQLIVQLAINKQGILRGNYTDELTDHTSPIRGSIDKKSQRAAWTVGDNKQMVMEAGLKDLTDNEAPALIHSSGKTDHWLLVRLTPPQ